MSKGNSAILIYKNVLKEFLKEKTVLSEQEIDSWVSEIDKRAETIAVEVADKYARN